MGFWAESALSGTTLAILPEMLRYHLTEYAKFVQGIFTFQIFELTRNRNIL